MFSDSAICLDWIIGALLWGLETIGISLEDVEMIWRHFWGFHWGPRLVICDMCIEIYCYLVRFCWVWVYPIAIVYRCEQLHLPLWEGGGPAPKTYKPSFYWLKIFTGGIALIYTYSYYTPGYCDILLGFTMIFIKILRGTNITSCTPTRKLGCGTKLYYGTTICHMYFVLLRCFKHFLRDRIIREHLWVQVGRQIRGDWVLDQHGEVELLYSV